MKSAKKFDLLKCLGVVATTFIAVPNFDVVVSSFVKPVTGQTFEVYGQKIFLPYVKTFLCSGAVLKELMLFWMCVHLGKA